MAISNFDPTAYGATLATPKSGGGFDPSAYGATPVTPTPTQSLSSKIWSGLASAGRTIVSAPATMLARPFQAGAELLGASEQQVNQATDRLTGGLVVPVPTNFADVKKDIGRGIQTAALGAGGAVSGGAAFGLGTSLEQGNNLLSMATAIDTALGAAGGKVLELMGKPIFNAAGKVIGKVTPQYLQDLASQGTKAITDFAAQHSILPDIISKPLNVGVQKVESVLNKPFEVAGKVKGAIVNKVKAPFTAKTDEQIFATPESQLKKLTSSEQSRYFQNKARQDSTYFKAEQDKITQSADMTAQEKTAAIQNLQQEQIAAKKALAEKTNTALQETRDASQQRTNSLIVEAKQLSEKAIPQASTDVANAAKKPTRVVIGKAGQEYRDIYGNELSGKGEIQINHNEANQMVERLYPTTDRYGNVSQDAIRTRKILGIKQSGVAGEIPASSGTVTSAQQFEALPFSEQNDIFHTLPRGLQNEIIGFSDIEARSPVQNLAHDIASGRVKVRAPKDIRTEAIEALGQGNYARIFRNDKPGITRPEALDELTSSLGISDSELLQEIKIALGERAMAKNLPSVGPGEQLPKGTFTTTLQNLSNKVLSLGQDIGGAGKAGTRVFTPDEMATQNAIHVLTELAKSKGLDLTQSRKFWADWAPVRNRLVQNVKPYSPSGLDTKVLADKITAVARGTGSEATNNAELIKTFEDHLGYSLTKDTKTLFNTLDKTEQSIVAEATRAVNQQRTIKSAGKAAQENLTSEGMAKNAALEESYQNSADKLARKTLELKKQQESATLSRESQQSLVKRQAEIRKNIKRIIFGTLGLGVAAGVTGEIVKRYF